MLNELNVRVSSLAQVPQRTHATDAGLDLKAAQDALVKSGERTLVKTGVQVQIPPGYVGLLVARSSLSSRNLILANGVGIIDSDYRGELMVALTYLGSNPFEQVSAGERIAQLLVVPIALPLVNIVHMDDEEWNDTDRGTGGFGSSGK